jgi:dTDP-4-dehydrorhamnose reductase
MEQHMVRLGALNQQVCLSPAAYCRPTVTRKLTKTILRTLCQMSRAKSTGQEKGKGVCYQINRELKWEEFKKARINLFLKSDYQRTETGFVKREQQSSLHNTKTS